MTNKPDPRKTVDQETARLEKTIAEYQSTQKHEDKVRYRGAMTNHLALIKDSVKGLREADRGIRKYVEKVVHDYDKFMTTGSDQDLNALYQDVKTLRDFNRAVG